jgi:hypothetical protein
MAWVLPRVRAFVAPSETLPMRGLRLQPHVLEHGDEEIAQRRLLSSRLKARCWPCLKPPPARRMGRLVLSCLFASPMLLPKRTIVRSSRRASSSRFAARFWQELAQQHHLLAVGVFELFHLFRSLAVMAEAVVAVGGVLSCILKDGRGKGIDHQRDDARGVGLQRELRHGEHEIELFKEQLLVLDVGGRWSCVRAWASVPTRGR